MNFDSYTPAVTGQGLMLGHTLHIICTDLYFIPYMYTLHVLSMYDYYYSFCNWKSVELLHQCMGNVTNYCLFFYLVLFCFS